MGQWLGSHLAMQGTWEVWPLVWELRSCILLSQKIKVTHIYNALPIKVLKNMDFQGDTIQFVTAKKGETQPAGLAAVHQRGGF